MTDLTKNLTTYLVGGAVRDQLLGLAVKERDWVVIGATPEQMLKLGFRPAGKDFPVFLHPQNGEQYALARTERKTARGYHGFEFVSDPTVTLEQDLMRRDLTVNAIAMQHNGKLIDPWGGKADLDARVLRHVSDAFAEDPVRILRVARFSARFAEQGFMVNPSTMRLMRQMVTAGEVDALVAERVWQEMHGALGLRFFPRFIEVLRQCGALARLLPEVDVLFGVPQTAQYHPEIDTGRHVMMALNAAVAASRDRQPDARVAFAVLLHDLGKGLTPEQELPAHHGHEQSGLQPVNQVCDRLRVPADFRRLALKVCEFHLHMHQIHQLKATTIMKLLQSLDAFRRVDDLNDFIICCKADSLGRGGQRPPHYDQGKLLTACYQAATTVDGGAIAATLVNTQQPGKATGEAIRRARIKAIAAVCKQWGDYH